jgi:hypothetical protein
MNYLHHVSKHISSSHGLSERKSPVRFFTIAVFVVVLVVIYLMFGTSIGNAIFGIRDAVAPSRDVSISLTPSAYDARLSALEIENNSLKGLLVGAGVTLPAHDELLGDAERISRMRTSAVDTASSEYVLVASTTAPDAMAGVSQSTQRNATSSPEAGSADASVTVGVQGESSVEGAGAEGVQTGGAGTGSLRGEGASGGAGASLPLVPISLSLKGDEVIASVLVRPPQTPFDALIVNVGSEEGVSVGDQVYAFTGFPIGTVIEVKEHRSTIMLLSAPGTKTEVLIGTSTQAVTAEGKGGGNFFLKLPKITEINVGDVVARTYLPPEVLSTIETVDSKEGEAYIYAYFKLPVSLNSLVYVLIKKNTY